MDRQTLYYYDKKLIFNTCLHEVYYIVAITED